MFADGLKSARFVVLPTSAACKTALTTIQRSSAGAARWSRIVLAFRYVEYAVGEVPGVPTKLLTSGVSVAVPLKSIAFATAIAAGRRKRLEKSSIDSAKSDVAACRS